MTNEPRADLVAAVDRSFAASYELLALHQPNGSVRRFGSAVAFTTGLPLAIFNGLIVTEPIALADLEAALDVLDEARLAHHVWIHEELRDSLAGPIVERARTANPYLVPGMWIRAQRSPVPAPSVTVRQVRDAADLDDHLSVLTRGGAGEELAQAVYPASFLADPDVRVFTGYLAGRPVGTSIAIRTGDDAGVYGVGTAREARGRGVGTAVSWAAVEAGLDWGCETVMLEASEMGEPIYARMGFRTVVRYAQFEGSAATSGVARA